MNNLLDISKSNDDISKIRIMLSDLEQGLINKKLDKKFYINPFIYYIDSEKYPALIEIDGVVQPLFFVTNQRMQLVRQYYKQEIVSNFKKTGKAAGMVIISVVAFLAGTFLLVQAPDLIEKVTPSTFLTFPIVIAGSISIGWLSIKRIFNELCNMGSGLLDFTCNIFKWRKLCSRQKKFEDEHYIIQRKGLQQLLEDIREDDRQKKQNKILSEEYYSEIPENILKSYSLLNTFL